MSQSKSFPLRVVLTVTTGRLLTAPRGPHDNGIGDVYEILNWITNDDLFTHQLPRAGRAAQPWLLECFPELAPVNRLLPMLDTLLHSERDPVARWLVLVRETVPELKDEYDIAPMPEGWTHIDPMIEAETMVDPGKIIKVEV